MGEDQRFERSVAVSYAQEEINGINLNMKTHYLRLIGLKVVLIAMTAA